MAAYADPARVSCLMMIPALDQGCRPWLGRAGPGPGEPPGPAAAPPPPPYRPVNEVTRAVMLPLPASGWCTK